MADSARALSVADPGEDGGLFADSRAGSVVGAGATGTPEAREARSAEDWAGSDRVVRAPAAVSWAAAATEAFPITRMVGSPRPHAAEITSANASA